MDLYNMFCAYMKQAVRYMLKTIKTGAKSSGANVFLLVFDLPTNTGGGRGTFLFGSCVNIEKTKTNLSESYRVINYCLIIHHNV